MTKSYLTNLRLYDDINIPTNALVTWYEPTWA